MEQEHTSHSESPPLFHLTDGTFKPNAELFYAFSAHSILDAVVVTDIGGKILSGIRQQRHSMVGKKRKLKENSSKYSYMQAILK